jgi:hypothetical protein
MPLVFRPKASSAKAVSDYVLNSQGGKSAENNRTPFTTARHALGLLEQLYF